MLYQRSKLFILQLRKRDFLNETARKYCAWDLDSGLEMWIHLVYPLNSTGLVVTQSGKDLGLPWRDSKIDEEGSRQGKQPEDWWASVIGAEAADTDRKIREGRDSRSREDASRAREAGRGIPGGWAKKQRKKGTVSEWEPDWVCSWPVGDEAWEKRGVGDRWPRVLHGTWRGDWTWPWEVSWDLWSREWPDVSAVSEGSVWEWHARWTIAKKKKQEGGGRMGRWCKEGELTLAEHLIGPSKQLSHLILSTTKNGLY